MKKIIAAATLSVILTGCTNIPDDYTYLPPEKLKDVPTRDLAMSYGEYPKESIDRELQRRGAIDEKWFDLINKDRVRVGMPEIAMFASFGRPHDEIKVSSIDGTTTIYQYHSTYVHIRDGAVVRVAGY